MKRFKLTKEEQEIEDSVDRGEWKSVLTPELKKYYQEVARYSIKMRKLEQAKLKKKEVSSSSATP